MPIQVVSLPFYLLYQLALPVQSVLHSWLYKGPILLILLVCLTSFILFPDTASTLAVRLLEPESFAHTNRFTRRDWNGQ